MLHVTIFFVCMYIHAFQLASDVKISILDSGDATEWIQVSCCGAI